MKLLIVDGNSILYAAQDGPKLTCRNMEVQGLYGMLRTLRSLLDRHRDHMPVVLWDGKVDWRFKLWPLYKGQRDETPEQQAMRRSVRRQRPEVVKFLHSLGVQQLMGRMAEADDIASCIVREGAFERALLVTGDKDWCQLIRDDVSWFDPRFDRSCNFNTFESFTGFKNPTLFVQAKALGGDTSDNVPGVGGFGEVAIKNLFEKFPLGVGAFIHDYQIDDGKTAEAHFGRKLPKCFHQLARNERPSPSKKWGEMAPAYDAYRRNKQLMDLSKVEVLESDLIRARQAPSETRFQELCQQFNFISLLRQAEWSKPFHDNYTNTHSHRITI
jgi:DNA polymerase-1